ncbi:HepT-like ribonuclease domain-containing protein [Desulfonatronovibrio magnus]|uniref:HepT-like ribonuclease domain-containing protein n=1 Tax=Desulfonatronovibrio magnus TaxID=698827 RepID=UPI0005EBE400|nr:DUF86 domain-containing protein [Desulfonatronovibrio magnus]
MSLSPSEYIRHMLDEIDYIMSRIPDTDYESFSRDETLKRAFVRSIEIIGEASKKLPEDIKAMQPEIEWRKVSGMRDKLIHDYFGVDYLIVWDAALNKLPDLRVKLKALLRQVQ